ncbi:hypothetical protein QT978_28135 [Microcoleus sp. SVA1_B3]
MSYKEVDWTASTYRASSIKGVLSMGLLKKEHLGIEQSVTTKHCNFVGI